jgi:hypothetical protein
MAKQGETPGVEFIDDPHAPEVFAGEAVGFFLNAGIIQITFASMRTNHGKEPASLSRLVIARLAMPIPGAQGLAAGLYNFLKTNGLDPVPVPEKDHLQ